MALHVLSQKELERRIKAAAGRNITKIADGSSLYLVVRKNGAASWQLAYRWQGVDKTYSIGPYPQVTLSTARDLAQAAREKIQKGIDPVEHRRSTRSVARNTAKDLTVQQLIEDWLERQRPTWSATHYDDYLVAAKRDVFPYIGTRKAASITADDIRQLLERVQKRGAQYKLTRVRSLLNRVFEDALDADQIASNPVARVKRRAYTAHREKHHPAIVSPDEFATLLRQLDADEATLPVMALRLNAYVFVRPQNLRSAEWHEFDLEAGVWLIPGSKMKMKRDFLVPLAPQTVELLRNLKCISGHSNFLFPSPRSDGDGMYGDTTFMKNLHRLGYKERHSTHGFRTTAKTLLEEGGFDSKYTEKQLAHEQDNKVERAYNRAEYWEDRVAMMRAWADYLDSLKQSDKAPSPWTWFASWRTRQSNLELPPPPTTTSGPPSLERETALEQ